MNCDLVREHVLEEGGSPDSSVDRHLEGCASCQEFVRDLTPLRGLLASALQAPPERVWQRLRPTVAARAGQAGSRAMRGWSGMGRRLLATAAALAAVVALAWHGFSDAPVPPPRASPPAVSNATPAGPVPGPPQARVDPAPTLLAGPGREDTDLRGVRAEIDWLQRDMQRF